MTDKKPLVLGKGRLYFGDRLLGDLNPMPGDELSLMRPRESTFKATFHIEAPAFVRWADLMKVIKVCGYNPQMLLTDQRSKAKKWADQYREIDAATAQAYVKQYREAFPDLLKAFTDNVQLGETYDPVKHFPSGGTVTGRWTGDRFSQFPRMHRMPAMLDHGEAIIPLAHVDFGKVEARAMAHYAIPRHVVEIKVNTSHMTEAFAKVGAAAEKMAKRMKEFGRTVSKMNDRMILLALFGDIRLDEPEPGFKYERRLAKLLKSPDRRQRKRGERLFNRWYHARKGINFTRMYGK
jgi:hypothetical protein